MTGPDDERLARAVREAVERYRVAYRAWHGVPAGRPDWTELDNAEFGERCRLQLATVDAVRAGLEVVVERTVETGAGGVDRDGA